MPDPELWWQAVARALPHEASANSCVSQCGQLLNRWGRALLSQTGSAGTERMSYGED